MKRIVVALAMLVALLVLVDGAQPAGARWAYGAGPSGIDLTTVAGSDGSSVCVDRVTGRVGLHATGDPGDIGSFVAPPGPYGTASVRVYVADVAFGIVSEVPGGLRRLSDGVVVPLLTSQTSPPLQLLTPPETYPLGTDIVYAAAPFDIALPNGSAEVGDFLAIMKPGASTPAKVRIVACSVSGFVRDGAGNPVRNASVRIGGQTAYTSATGAYLVAGLSSGSYQGVVDAVCRPSAQLPVTVGGSSPVTLNFVMGTSSGCTVDAQQWDTTSSVLPLTGDDASLMISLPFPYPHQGVDYGNAFVSTNGVVNFAAANAAYVNTLIPAVAAPNAAIYPFWDDLTVDASSSVRTATGGTAPNRRFVIEWRNVALLADTSRRLSFQVVLYEDRNQRVRMQYRSIDPDTAEAGTSATAGTENAAGTSATVVSYNQGLLFDGLSVRPK